MCLMSLSTGTPIKDTSNTYYKEEFLFRKALRRMNHAKQFFSSQ